MNIIKKPNEDAFLLNEPKLADLIPDDGLLVEHMKANLKRTKEFFMALPEDKLNYRYASGKWNIREILNHLSDMERIYAYRALRFARNDATGLPGFDDKQYVHHSRANERTILDLFKEFETVRYATISLAESFDETALTQSGKANGNTASVSAILYHIAGHELHHIKIIKERYLH